MTIGNDNALITIADLRRNALFADVKVSELRRILPTLRKEYYPRSALICREGEQGSSIYIILSGQVKLSVTENTHSTNLGYLNAGDFFGESAVLTNEPRAITAEAVIDAEVVLFSQQSFHELVERDPTIMHNMIRTIDQRIRKKTLGLFHQQPKHSQIISIYSPKRTPWKTFLAVHLAASLFTQTLQPVVVLDMTMNAPNIARILRMEGIEPVEDEITEETLQYFCYHHPSGFYLMTMSDELLRTGKISRERIAGILGMLKASYQYVLINTSTEISNNTFEALDLSNMVVLLSPVAEEPPIGMFDHQEIITVYYTPQAASQSLLHSTEMTPLLLPSDQDAERLFYEQGEMSLSHTSHHGGMNLIIHKIARHIANLRIGLALGGMAARGLAHIGVLKVLERNAITIDMIAGSNTGALVGAMYALGMSIADIEQAAFEVQKSLPLVSFRDFSLLSGGLLSHRRIRKLISEYIPEKLTFHDLHISLRIITMALDVGKEVPLSSGSLLKALEASIAMPGIFPPINYDGNFLVDGSTINPVPMSDLIEMEADILVGVNSFGQLSPSYTPPPENYINLVGYAENMKMIDIITRSFQNLQYEISSAKAMIADVTIIPDLLGYTWVDFKHAQGIIEAGEKAAEKMLPELKRVIENRRLYRRF